MLRPPHDVVSLHSCESDHALFCSALTMASQLRARPSSPNLCTVLLRQYNPPELHTCLDWKVRLLLPLRARCGPKTKFLQWNVSLDVWNTFLGWTFTNRNMAFASLHFLIVERRSWSLQLSQNLRLKPPSESDRTSR